MDTPLKRVFETLRTTLASRKVLGILSVVVILLAVPVTVYIAQQRQDIRQRASGQLEISGISQNATTDNGHGCTVNFSIGTNVVNSPRALSVYYQQTASMAEEWLGGAHTDASGYLYVHKDFPYASAAVNFPNVAFKAGNETDGWAVLQKTLDVNCVSSNLPAMTCVIDSATLSVPATRTANVKFHTNRAPNMTTERPTIKWGRDDMADTIISSSPGTQFEANSASYPADGTYTVTVSVNRVDGTSLCTNPIAERQKTLSIGTTSPAPLSCTLTVSPATVNTGDTVTATFTTGGRTLATGETPKILWGVGTAENLTGSASPFSGTHTYTQGGSMLVEGNVYKADGTALCPTNTQSSYQKTVQVAAPTATATTVPPTATATTVPPTAGAGSPTPTGAATASTLALTLNLGIGAGKTIQTQQRNISVELYDKDDTLVGSAITLPTALQYNSTTGKFTGNVPLTGVAAGNYTIKVKTNRYLKKRLPNIISVTTTVATITPSEVTLIAGNVNNDTTLDIQDYNALLACFGPKATSTACGGNKTNADLDDDGDIDEFDYNMLIRNFAVRQGD